MDHVTKTAVSLEENYWTIAQSTFLMRHQDSNPKKINDFLQDRASVLDAKAACQTAQNTAKAQYSPTLGGIMEKIECFMNLGDIAIKFAPESIGLAWTGIRLCLRAVEDDYATFSLFSRSSFDIIGILLSCGVYGKMYGCSEGPEEFQELHQEVVKRIPEIYADILEFSYAMKKHMSNSKLLRVTKGIFQGTSTMFQAQMAALKEGEANMSRFATLAHERLSNYYQKDSSKNQQVMLEQLSAIKGSLDESAKINNQLLDLIKKFEEERKSMRKMTPLEQAREEFNTNCKALGATSNQDVSLATKKETRDRDTCNWIFPLEKYASWQDASLSSLLWVSGQGGFGKSVLMSAVIESLQTKYANSPDVVVHYFFVTAGDEATQKSERILKHILYQLYALSSCSLKAMEACNKIVADFVKKKGSKGQQSQKDSAGKGRSESDRDTLDFDAAYASVAVTLQKTVYLVIDGVDECIDRQQQGFLKALRKVSEAPGVNLKLMICSRPETDITLALEAVSQIKVEEYNAKDIERHANTQLQKLPGWTPSERALACAEIVKKAGSYFRYVEVAMEILRQPWVRPIENKLKELPEGLNNIYSQVLQKTNPAYLGLLRTCLTWTILAVEGSIRVAEVVDAYSQPYSQVGEEGFTDEDSDPMYSKLYQEQVTIAGGSFIEVDPKTTWVSLRHNTVADYFLDKKREEDFAERSHDHCNTCVRCQSNLGGKDPFLITRKSGHVEIATTIFSHLNSPAFRKRFYPPEEEELLAPEESATSERSNNELEQGPPSKFEGQGDLTPNGITADGTDSHDLALAGQEHKNSTLTLGQPEEVINTAVEIEIQVNVMPTGSETNATGNGVSREAKERSFENLPTAPEDADVVNVQDDPEEGADDKDRQESAEDADEISVVDSDIGFKPSLGRQNEDIGDTADVKEEDEVRYEIVASNYHLQEIESMWAPEERTGPLWDKLWKELDNFWKEGEAFRAWAKIKCSLPDTPYSPEEGNNITPLHFTAANVLPEMTARLLERGDDFQATTAVGRQPLHMAAEWAPLDESEQKRKSTVLKLLLDKGAPPNVTDKSATSRSAFHTLLDANPALEDVRLFLDKEADCKFQDAYGRYPLHCVAESGTRVEVLYTLLEASADINAKDTWGLSPLHRLVWRQDVPQELLTAFLKSGADVNMDDNDSQRPLHRVCARGDFEIASILIEAGADIEDDDINGSTALHAAAWNAETETVRVLINRGARLDRCDNQGRLPLHAACENETPDTALLLVEAMLKAGNNINQASNKGKTPLRKACAWGHIELVKILLDNIEDPSNAIAAVDPGYGQTCLHAAARNGYGKIVELLLSYGTDTTARDKQGRTALSLCYQSWAGIDPKEVEHALILLIDANQHEAKDDLELLIAAAIQGSVVVIHKLCELGVDLNRRDEHGWTPLQLSNRYGRTEAAEALGRGAVPRLKPTKWTGTIPKTFTISKDGLQVESHQPSDYFGLNSLFSNHPVPAEVERYYYEVAIAHHSGEEGKEVNATIGIGFCQGRLKSTKGWFPGHPSKINPANPRTASWGYHGDDGNLYQDTQNNSLPELGVYMTGDTIGCGVDFKENVIFFTRNGERLPDTKFTEVKGRLYPALGLYGTISTVVNFGADKEKKFLWEPANGEDFKV